MGLLRALVAVVIALNIVILLTPVYIVLTGDRGLEGFTERELFESLLLSVVTSTASCIIVLVVAIPVSFYIARFTRGINRRLLLGLLIAPMLISPSAMGSLLLIFFTHNPLGSVIDTYLGVVNDPKGVVVAQVAISLPVAVGYYIALFTSIPSTYEEVALIHGLSRLEYLFKVLLPMTRRQVFLGSIVVFARSFADFGASLILGGGIRGRTWTLPIYIFMSIQYGELTAISTILIVYFIAIFALSIFILSIEHGEEIRV